MGPFEFASRWNVLLRDDEGVDRGPRIDIPNGERVVVLGNARDGEGAGGHLAEEAVGWHAAIFERRPPLVDSPAFGKMGRMWPPLRLTHRLGTLRLMRIAQINDIASVASELTRGLQARGHDVTLMQPPLRGARLHPLVKPLVGPARAMEWVDLLRKIHAGKYELAHIHYAYLGNVGALGGVPYILHCHGTDLRESTAFTRPLIRNALRHARHVFYSTPDLARYLHDLRPDAEFLPNPIDTRAFDIEKPPSEAHDVFICCGLTEVKGVERIYNACRRLAVRRPDVRFTAIGEGPVAREFEALGNVTLLPRQPRSRFPGIINAHAVVLGQARLGAIGMAELEAMSCGRPVVTWFNQPHVYAEEPPCIRAVDGYDLAQAVIQLVDDPSLRDSLGVAARAWIQRYHGLDEVVARVETVSRLVIEGELPARVRTAA